MEMNNGQRDQTRDFMNVESFAQLPFIRPSPPVKEKSNGGCIRLFGKEFGGNNYKNSTRHQDNSSESTDNNEESTKLSATSNNRKFKCHYCCRNFPTSQALGGHQNAHKRERQQAKRAHLQTVMVHNGLAHHHDARVYGLVSYDRSAPMIPLANYHSWNNSMSSGNDSNSGVLHGAHLHQQPLPPINGPPWALWRIPGGNDNGSLGFNREHASVTMHHKFLPSFDSKDRELTTFSSSMQDPMSLDLHL